MKKCISLSTLTLLIATASAATQANNVEELVQTLQNTGTVINQDSTTFTVDFSQLTTLSQSATKAGYVVEIQGVSENTGQLEIGIFEPEKFDNRDNLTDSIGDELGMLSPRQDTGH
ncbi:hypothetical protein [Aliivibrio fischeri]|uniref:hypothetical protein n=1 Tax=Aliivibrio fischeri TaxID=668 RepID=UPI00080E600B|nr:hypothetical protein [Aliivibrio fischeri]OCH38013.1 hypothetical protein A6D99_12985 [Aliivibrio fischeri]OED51682.1 hypothetical protein BEI46_05645 [Aliivibrio fischeri]